MADRTNEIIRLQNQIIRDMTRRNLLKVGEDLWGPVTEDTVELTPPPGFPPVPDVLGERGDEEDRQADGKDAPKAAQEQSPVIKEDMDTLLAELNSYIGLDVVKAEVESLINLVKVNKLRRQHELPTEELSLHMVFSGNPGTGKTMIARLMSRIYHSLGILSKGHLVEVDRSGLVAGYVGQTAIKTKEVIDKALGGVLFIDEAYALSTRGSQDYGQEAIETLLKNMEDHREDLVVIVAGYVDLMNDFVHSNPGLQSRFNRFLYFPDYSVEEMAAIFEMRCKKAGYQLDEEADSVLRRIIKEESEDNIGFGNARGVRNLFEQAVSRQANRLAKKDVLTREELMTLTAEDLEDGVKVEVDGEDDDGDRSFFEKKLPKKL
ncbi:MAG: AAA family ATPase [Clostridiales bacterium]|nr:AAA family ATPase [Clostridiales bacterium]